VVSLQDVLVSYIVHCYTCHSLQEYSWEDHGYPFLNSLYPDIGPLLDEKFNMALQMTYRQCVS
jgi:hypothetical protein